MALKKMIMVIIPLSIIIFYAISVLSWSPNDLVNRNVTQTTIRVNSNEIGTELGNEVTVYNGDAKIGQFTKDGKGYLVFPGVKVKNLSSVTIVDMTMDITRKISYIASLYSDENSSEYELVELQKI